MMMGGRGKFLVSLVLVASMATRTHQASNVTLEASTYAQNVSISNNEHKPHADYKPVWPEMKIGWAIMMGAVIGLFGAAFGSAGGVGGGGIFFPMLTIIIGFDAKSSIAISKCMITGTSVATTYYNLNKRHPKLDMPMIDYDLALLVQPMLVLGVSIGVALNVILADWMVTVLLIVVFIFISIKAFLKGIAAWKKETEAKQEAHRLVELNGAIHGAVVVKPYPVNITNSTQKGPIKPKVSIIENIDWMALGILFSVWLIIFGLQIIKHHTPTCSTAYWLLDFAQIPAAATATMHQAISLYKGRRVIASKGEAGTNWGVCRLILYSFIGLFAGVLGGMLGLGGGFILNPVFLEIGIPPQVSSATATFAMTFSAALSVAKYYLLKRFPVPYALYFFLVATTGAFLGQHVVKKVVDMLGRASIIIFILSTVILISAISLGGSGVINIIEKIHNNEYMGFDNICSYA